MYEKTLTDEQMFRYSRQILLAGFDMDKQEILMNSKVLMLGVGGLGCAAAQYLVAAGVGQLTLVDDDRVELTNLQRQVLHCESNIGSKKVDSAYQSLQQLNRHVKLIPIDERLSESALTALVAEHDLVLDCTDNLATRNQLNAICYRQQTPLVSGAAIRMEGQVFCVLPQQQSACYGCISHFFGEQNLSCVESGVMSPIVGIIGATQANEAIKILTNYGQLPVNTLQVFDGLNSHWERFSVKRLADCVACSTLP